MSTLANMDNHEQHGTLQVAKPLADFVHRELLPAIGISADLFWRGLEELTNNFTTRNSTLLATRDELQASIDDWHRRHANTAFEPQQYREFLISIGYLVAAGDRFSITTSGVDHEITTQAGPQLVVPVKNARFALNAANARWGSLYDALYGTDSIPESNGADRSGAYNPVRGAAVVAYARRFLDQACPLESGSHATVSDYSVCEGQFVAQQQGAKTGLLQPECFVAYSGPVTRPSALLLKHNNLHIELQIDPDSPIGKTDKAGVKDIVLEAAITTIQDCEDSVAAVDAEDKVEVYRNWLGLMTGELRQSFSKGGAEVTRELAVDRIYSGPTGEAVKLSGRSLLLVRNVGLLMRNPAVLDHRGEQIYEGILDAFITSSIGYVDVKKKNTLRNSQSGSIYIVKPKLHGPDEVQFTVDLFQNIEDILELPRNTIKIGIMDEERRTTVNLQECIRVAKERVVFINTGFLDRTGDEIHTSMHAGAMPPKAEMKNAAWIKAYEDNNVNVGLACGFSGRAQIGKGMWAMPDLMARMLDEKGAHPQAGANTAWVPSPTAAVLHAMHYHQVNVRQRQQELLSRSPVAISEIISLPLLSNIAGLSGADIQAELDNNVQGILGYVVRWVEQGVGCSKVPDIQNVGLMEDRATLRISSQHIANWLAHGICSRNQVMDTLQRMAQVVDKQNAADPAYQPMSPDFSTSIAFQAACDLVFTGIEQPNGYTEPVLHRYRLLYKQMYKQNL